MYKIPNLDKILGFKHYISTVDDGNMSTSFVMKQKFCKIEEDFGKM